MSLKGKFADHFSPKIRDRGVAYFRSGLVKILNHSDTLVEAEVKGRERYQVRLKLSKVSLDIACTCPYFDGGEECKHVWATMLAADSYQYLAQADLRPRLMIHFDDDAAAELTQVVKQETPPEVRPPLWQKQLSLVANAAENGVERNISDWTDRRQILYVIDPQASRAINNLRVEIGYRQRKVNGDWSKIKLERIPKNVIAALSDPDDREILSIIAGVETGYYNVYSYDFTNIGTMVSIPGPLVERLLPLMCRTGRCVLRSKEKPGEFVPVEWDDGPPWQFWMALAADDRNDQYVLSPLLRRGAEQLDLDSI
ncbi:MAG TPA: SWIM zinc finger family protein, partial [Pyrinomonadaceae bacterium]|nr:SWIM zinc finger family protein [Pyrinomonadaceae bacterium]